MVKKSFKTSLKEGNQGQKYFTDVLDSLKIKWDTNNDINYDIITLSPFVSTFEIKNDLFFQKSGNLAIEYWNSKKNKPSGLNATTATYWIHVLGPQEILIAKVLDLRKFCSTVEPTRIIKGGGDKNSDLFLYKKEVILSVPFIKIDKNNFLQVLSCIPIL